MQDHARRQVAYALKSLELPEEFWQSVFKSQVREVVVGVTGSLIKMVHSSLADDEGTGRGYRG